MNDWLFKTQLAFIVRDSKNDLWLINNLRRITRWDWSEYKEEEGACRAIIISGSIERGSIAEEDIEAEISRLRKRLREDLSVHRIFADSPHWTNLDRAINITFEEIPIQK